LKLALDNTHRTIWVRSTRQTRMARMGQLIGFARATSDGVFSATIWDVAVSPVWQRSGLGRAIMERLTRLLVQDGIATIALYAEPKVSGEGKTYTEQH
jgi:ribosomal protein S18 acetylase RimI-like enzyme